MVLTRRYVAIILFVLAVVSLAMGIVFIQQSVAKVNMVKQLAHTERVTLGIPEDQAAKGEMVDSYEEMLTAGNTIRTHRQNIALTYSELLAGGRFDPTNPKHLSYAQAINLENYLYLGSLSFGLTQVVLAIGVFMIIVAIAFGVTGIALLGLAPGTSRTT